jgi:hypothetical protein
MIDGQHMMVVLQEGREIVRTPCSRVDLGAKVKQTSHRTMLKDDQRILTEIRINGETFAHRLVP